MFRLLRLLGFLFLRFIFFIIFLYDLIINIIGDLLICFVVKDKIEENIYKFFYN